MQDTEFYNPFFQPRLRPYLPREAEHYADLALINDIGIPAPTLNNKKAAVWWGSKVNRYQEVPVVSVNVEPMLGIDTNSRWYIGSVNPKELMEISNSTDSVSPREALLLEASVIGPFSVKSLYEAFQRLRSVCPL